MLGLLPQDPHEHGELVPPPSFISWGSQDLTPLTLILLGMFPLSLFGALLRALHAGCGGHHRQDLAQLVEGSGREGFLEEEVPE